MDEKLLNTFHISAWIYSNSSLVLLFAVVFLFSQTIFVAKKMAVTDDVTALTASYMVNTKGSKNHLGRGVESSKTL